jgi:riboflavin synthase
VFTGIVEAVGQVESVAARGDVVRLVVGAPELAGAVALGDSVAVNGTCLTIAEADPTRLHFDAIPETLEKTSLGALSAGGRVNLERAMRADGRFDGHIVQGHVDECGSVQAWQRDGDDVRLSLTTSPGFANALIEKGSVTIDGVALTIVGLRADGFDVALIPHTLEVTTLGDLEPGAPVNLEGDVIGKYVKRYLERMAAGELASELQ